jgi:manganese/zinc/iron transport system substrate-binding protein
MLSIKKVLFLLLLPLLAIGCFRAPKSRLGDWMQDDGKIKILSTTAQVGDLVTAVGGDRVSNWVLIQGELDPHSYEIVKGDGEKLSRADLIFYNGLGLEHGAALSAQLRNSPKATGLGERIQKVHPEKILLKDGAVDPHIWMDISLWKEAVPAVVEELSKLDPEGAPEYRKRGEALMLQMEEAHLALVEKMQKIPSEKRYLVTSHDAFHYFTRSYLANPGEKNWTDRFAAPEGLAPDGQLSPVDIQNIIDYLRAHKISVVFPESNVSRDSIRKIASAGREMGLEIEICSEPLYGDSMSHLSYLEMMRQNGDVIARYLHE